jgi:hypothetical protein|tara:strand:- start:24 stop:218 length:195 start_codon:yes stop_codon:yes gene_type:complete
VKAGDLVKPSSKVQLLDSPFRPHEWSKAFLVVSVGHFPFDDEMIFIWRNEEKFLINKYWLEKHP